MYICIIRLYMTYSIKFEIFTTIKKNLDKVLDKHQLW